jgi:hypothetical protein
MALCRNPIGRGAVSQWPSIQRKKSACICVGVCPRCKEEALQAELRINQPRDRHEQEADRMAERVTQAPDPRRLEKPLTLLRYSPTFGEGEFSEVGLLTDSCWIHRCWLRCEGGRALSRGSFPFPSGCSLPLPLFVHHPRRMRVLRTSP